MRFVRLASVAGAAYLLSAIPCIQPALAQTPQAAPAPLSAAQEQALRPGKSFKECTNNCPEMIVLPAGSFMMGRTDAQCHKDCDVDVGPSPNDARCIDAVYRTCKDKCIGMRCVNDNDQPQHNVTLAKPFAVAKFELTFAEWDACVADQGCSGYKPDDRGWGRGQQPVININLDDAQQYVAWLAKLTGKPYRLLTEAEYEYATRAGTTTAYPWGDNVKLNGQAMANCFGCGSQWDNKQTAPVGSFAPNKFGLYDMVGNVDEWTADCFHTNYNEAPADGSAWLKANQGDCSKRMLRGNSPDLGPDGVRSANRGTGLGFPTGNRGYAIGFRVGRTLIAP